MAFFRLVQLYQIRNMKDPTCASFWWDRTHISVVNNCCIWLYSPVSDVHCNVTTHRSARTSRNFGEIQELKIKNIWCSQSALTHKLSARCGNYLNWLICALCFDHTRIFSPANMSRRWKTSPAWCRPAPAYSKVNRVRPLSPLGSFKYTWFDTSIYAGSVETTENTYKYHMQVQQDSLTTPTRKTAPRKKTPSNTPTPSIADENEKQQRLQKKDLEEIPDGQTRTSATESVGSTTTATTSRWVMIGWMEEIS